MKSEARRRGTGVNYSYDEDKTPTRKGSFRSYLLRGFAVAAIATCLLVLYQFADRQHVTALVHWVDQHRVKGAVVLMLVQIAFTTVLAIAAGALFGFVYGLLLIWAACVIAETLAFALGRYLFRAYIERVSAAWPTWIAMEAALKEDGWKLVLLLRCCPASPFTLLNYALGSTSLPFSHFFWPSVFGIAPGIALYVWGGNLIKDLSEVAHAEGVLANAAPPQARIAFAIVSGITAILVLVGSAWYTKRALARRLARVGSGPHADTEAQALLGSGSPLTGPGVARQDSRTGVAMRPSGGGRARLHQAHPPAVPPATAPPPPAAPSLAAQQSQQQQHHLNHQQQAQSQQHHGLLHAQQPQQQQPGGLGHHLSPGGGTPPRPPSQHNLGALLQKVAAIAAGPRDD